MPYFPSLPSLPSTLPSTLFSIRFHFIKSNLQGNLVEMEEIDFEGNRLDTLPDSFQNLVKLQKLYISRNHFSVLPPCLKKMNSLLGILTLSYSFFLFNSFMLLHMNIFIMSSHAIILIIIRAFYQFKPPYPFGRCLFSL